VRRHHGSAAAVPARLPVIRRLTCIREADRERLPLSTL
jgi:hypothetical protein